MLSKPNNLRSRTSIPAPERFISACAHEVLGGQSDGTDTVEVACELLEGGECDGGEEVDAAVWCDVVGCGAMRRNRISTRDTWCVVR